MAISVIGLMAKSLGGLGVNGAASLKAAASWRPGNRRERHKRSVAHGGAKAENVGVAS
jgi:hypothetical protein